METLSAKTHRGRLAVGIVLTALVTLVVVSGPNLWRWATTKLTFLYDMNPFAPPWSGYYTVKRWSDPFLRSLQGRSEGNYDENGYPLRPGGTRRTSEA